MKKIIWFGLMTLAFSPLMVHADENSRVKVAIRLPLARRFHQRSNQERIRHKLLSRKYSRKSRDGSIRCFRNYDYRESEPVDSAVIASIQAETGTQDVSEINTLADEPSSLRSALTRDH